MRDIENGVEYEILKSRPKELKGMRPILVWKDKDYAYGNYKFFIKENRLYLSRSKTKSLIAFEGVNFRGVAEKSLSRTTPATWIIFKDFRQYTALELINAFVDKDEKIWFDPILKIWKDLGLPLGFQENSLKDLR